MGAETTVHVDVRVVAATNRDLEEEIEAGRFREDLFYRLNVIPVRTPPLRERLEDLPLLVEYFVRRFAREHGYARRRFSPEAIGATSQALPWRGNVRELRNLVERLLILAPGETVGAKDVVAVTGGAAEPELETRCSRHRTLREFRDGVGEAVPAAQAARSTSWNVTQTAQRSTRRAATSTRRWSSTRSAATGRRCCRRKSHDGSREDHPAAPPVPTGPPARALRRRSPDARRRARRRGRATSAGSAPRATTAGAKPFWKDDFTTVSGMEVPALVTADEVRADPARDIGVPGEFPFTRGIHPTGYRGKLWTMRQFAGFGTAADTNQRFRYLLAHGQTGLSVAFDLPTLYGYDSDHEMSRGEVGKCGVAVDSLADMERLFDGIPLAEVSTSMTINSTAPILFAMYLAVAEKQGVDIARPGLAARCRTTSSRSTSRRRSTSSRRGRRCA